MTNDEAKQTMRTLTSLFDTYNETGFLDETNKIVLTSYREVAFKALKLVQFLKTKEPHNEAIHAYETFCRKLLLRFSYLINHGRKETNQELQEWFSGCLTL